MSVKGVIDARCHSDRKKQSLRESFDATCYDNRVALHDMEVGVAEESVGTVSSQTSPPYLTDDEVAERRSTLAPFWAVPCCFEIDYSMEEALYHSVVMARQTTPQILDQLLDAGADSSAWRTSGMISLPSEDELQPSQLSISTPLHTAIATNNLSMLHALLDRGFSPDARAMITGSQALTPLQYAIVIGDTASCSLLKSRGADPGLRTPVFDVHALPSPRLCYGSTC